MNRTINIGTRGSKLALYQAYRVKETLEQEFPDNTFEIVIIKTKGDKILDVPLSKIGDKGLFTKELEVSLLKKEIDMAVHSLKDLPTVFPEGTQLGGVLERGTVNDALVSIDNKKLSELTTDDVIATSSLRRKAQLLKINKDFKIVEIRGNVNTRIRKMQEGHCTAMMMAAAGLERLEMEEHISETIDPETMIPACSQGAIGIEIRENDSEIANLIGQINHQETAITTEAERAFLRTLEGGCQIPVGSYSQIKGEQFEITGFISSIDGSVFIKDKATGPVKEAKNISIQLAKDLSERGGKAVLDAIRNINLAAPEQDLTLQGKTFVATSTLESNKRIAESLITKAAHTVALPMIEIKISNLKDSEKAVVKETKTYDWIFFTSKNGVSSFFKHLMDITGDTHLPSSVKMACIGDKTAAELDYYGYAPSFTSKGNNSKDLFNLFTEAHPEKHLNIILALGNLADHYLEEQLSQIHKVNRLDVYNTVKPENIDQDLIKEIKEQKYTGVIFTSPSAFHNFKAYFTATELESLKFYCIGTTTEKAITEAGYSSFITAKKSNTEGLTEAITNYYKDKN